MSKLKLALIALLSIIGLGAVVLGVAKWIDMNH